MFACPCDIIQFNRFTSLLIEVYVLLNMFRAPPLPSSGAYNCINSLCFYLETLVVAALLVVLPPRFKLKPEAVNAVVRF